MTTLTQSLVYGIVPKTKSYVGLKKILIGKLTALNGGDGADLFANVYGWNESKPDGYPCCYVSERTGSGNIIDTGRNKREWQFDIVVHQIVGEMTTEESSVVLLDAVDRIVKMIDEDPTLTDSHGQMQCMWAKVIPVEFDWAKQATATHRALLRVAIVDIVNRYPA